MLTSLRLIKRLSSLGVMIVALALIATATAFAATPQVGVMLSASDLSLIHI